MKKIQYILAGTVLASFSLGAQAQTQPQDTTMNRTVVVEQEYNPDIMDASKINVLPKVEPPTVSKKAVEYDATLMPATHIPAGIMQAYAGKEMQPKAQPGYARLGYGNYGNLDARANYLFSLSPKDRLNLTFAMDGMDGKLDLPDDGGKWNSFYYRTHAAMDYVHAFNKVDLNVAGKFGLSNFNLQPGSINSKQKFTSGDVHFGVKSTSNDMPFQFRAETNLLFYERQHDFDLTDTKESIVRTKADVTGHISDEQFIGLAFDMDNIFYNGNALKNYHILSFNPYYLFQNDDWKVRLGAHVNYTFGYGKGWFAAPDLSAQYTFSDSYILYAQATGGKLQNDFRRLEAIDPYASISTQAEPTYEQLNAAIGFKASPLPNFWLHIYGGYQRLKNDFYTVLYKTNPEDTEAKNYYFMQDNDNNIYAGAEISYSYKDFLSFNVAGIFHSWNAEFDEDQLYLKPAFETNARIDIRPISPVTVSIGHQFISREGESFWKAASVNNLYLGGSYEIFKDISIYARANNLLNKSYQFYRGYPAEGLNFLGGVSFRF